MDAVIKIPASEFTQDLFNKISDLLKNNKNAEITIAVKQNESNESNDAYFKRLQKSITDIENGKAVIFTMDELTTFSKEN